LFHFNRKQMDREYKSSWIFKQILNLVCITVFLVPISSSYVYDYEAEMEIAKKNYIHSSIESLAILILFSTLWIFYQVIKNQLIKMISKIGLLIISIILVFYGFLMTAFPIQDFRPEWECLTLFLFLPLLAIIFILERSEKRSMKKLNSEIIDAKFNRE